MKSTSGKKQSNSTQKANGKNQSPNGSSQSKTKSRAETSGNQGQENERSERQSQNTLLEKFFHDQLKDMYWAEKHLIQALPKMQEAATTEELQEAFIDHLYVTQRQAARLEKVFQLLGKKAEGKKCQAMDGLTKEADEIISETQEGTMTRDAALIIAAQKIEHYEIATYGGLVQLAITLGHTRAADLLDKSLIEEEDTDWALTEIAENYINLEAEEEGEDKFYWKKDDQEESSRENQSTIPVTGSF